MKKIPPSPAASHSWNPPRNPFVCCHPSCQLSVPVAASLCELHGSPHRDRQDDDETP